MSRARFTALLIAAFLAIAGALYLSTRRDLPRDTRGTSLLPALADQLNTVNEVSVRKGAPAANVTIHKSSDRWTIAQRGDYPADVAKLRRLLLALSDAKIVEEKTANPASYPIIGVEDPSKPGAAGAQVELTAGNGKFAVIIGKSAGEGSFVRRVGESKSYIAEPSISVDSEPRQWIDSRLIDIASDKIDRMDVKPADGPGYSVHRAKDAAAKDAAAKDAPPKDATATHAPPKDAPANADFILDGVPAGRKAADGPVISPSPTTLSGLNVEDVAPAAAVDFSTASTAVLTLSDGRVLTITGTSAGDKHWIRVAASKDDALNGKASQRAFEIAGYRYDSIFRPLEQLLVPKEAPAAKPNPSGHPAAHAPAPTTPKP